MTRKERVAWTRGYFNARWNLRYNKLVSDRVILHSRLTHHSEDTLDWSEAEWSAYDRGMRNAIDTQGATA